MATKSSAVSWIGVLMSFIQILVKYIRELGADPDSIIRWLTTPEAEQTVRQMANVAVVAIQNRMDDSQVYRYQVNGSCSVDDLVRLGDYQFCDDAVEADFTIADSRVREVEAKLIAFGDDVTVLEAAQRIEALYSDWRVANTEEFLGFGAQNPDVQKYNTVVCAGASGISKHNQVACLALDSSHNSRRLWVISQTTKWAAGTKFLLIRKAPVPFAAFLPK